MDVDVDVDDRRPIVRTLLTLRINTNVRHAIKVDFQLC